MIDAVPTLADASSTSVLADNRFMVYRLSHEVSQMSDVSADTIYRKIATARFIQELASSADIAQVTGDHSRCVAIVENIYDLLDRQSCRQTDRPLSSGEAK